MEQKDTFICPKCNTTWDRSEHYKAILRSQNFINMLMGNPTISDMCGKCNHFIKEDTNEVQ